MNQPDLLEFQKLSTTFDDQGSSNQGNSYLYFFLVSMIGFDWSKFRKLSKYLFSTIKASFFAISFSS